MFNVIIFKVMPRPKFMFWLGFTLGWSYASVYEWFKKKTIAYHKDQLRNLDLEYRFAEAGAELVRRRNDARDKGIGPMDPGYPELEDVLPSKG